MKKLILIFSTICILFITINLNAQVSGYTFTNTTGTYNELTGGDTIAHATHTSIDPFNLNDVTYGPFTIPFIFTFNCIDYTNYFVNTNGFITFGPTAPVIANYGPVSSSESYEGAISAFGLDLIGVFGTTIDFSGVTNVLTDVRNFQGVVVGAHITAATGIPANTFITSFNSALGTITISNNTTDIIVNDLVVQIASGSIISKTEGVTPNRVHTIQFKNFRQYIITGTDDNFNFQIKLFEPTYVRTGAIQIVFGNMYKNTAPVPSVNAQVGLRGLGATDFNNRSNSGTLDWAASTGGGNNAVTSMLSSTVFPVSGLTYIWDGPCGLLPVEMSSFISSVHGNNVTLKWSTVAEKNNSGFDIERTIVNGNWVKVGNVTGNGTTTSPNYYSYTNRNVASGKYNYRLKQIDFNGNFEYFNLINEVNVGVPDKFNLSQNYPNPFNPTTKINYDLPADGLVRILLFDLSGKEVATLVNEVKTAGYYIVSFNALNLPSGVYFYKLTEGDFTAVKRMVLIK